MADILYEKHNDRERLLRQLTRACDEVFCLGKDDPFLEGLIIGAGLMVEIMQKDTKTPPADD